jgi:hypothetical protein
VDKGNQAMRFAAAEGGIEAEDSSNCPTLAADAAADVPQ